MLEKTRGPHRYGASAGVAPQLRGALLSVLLVLFPGNAQPQESNYLQVLVANRVTIEIPKHWEGLSIDQRRNLAAASDAVDSKSSTRRPPGHVASLAVSATPSPPGAIIRVSMIPTEPLTQSDLKQALSEDRAGTLAELRSVFRQEMAELAKQMQQQGLRMLGQEEVAIDSIGGQTAISVSYRRTSSRGPSPFKVTQYHVPLGAEKALITLSFRESDAIVYSQIIDYVKNSISIR